MQTINYPYLKTSSHLTVAGGFCFGGLLSCVPAPKVRLVLYLKITL